MTKKTALRILFLVIAASLPSLCRAADPPINPAVPVEQPGTWKAFSVKHVSVPLMAWWLDPRANSAPPEITSNDISTVPGTGLKRPMPLMPEGILTVVAAVRRREILAYGTEAGFQALEKLLTTLDVVSRLKVRLRRVEIDGEGLKTAGIGDDETKVWLQKSGDFEQTLKSLVGDKHAKIISDVTQTARSGIPFASTYLRFYPVKAVVQVTPFVDGPITIAKDTILLNLQSSMGSMEALGLRLRQDSLLSVTPLENNDGTVTLKIRTGSPLTLFSGPGHEAILENVLGKALDVTLPYDNTTCVRDARVLPGQKNTVLTFIGVRTVGLMDGIWE